MLWYVELLEDSFLAPFLLYWHINASTQGGEARTCCLSSSPTGAASQAAHVTCSMRSSSLATWSWTPCAPTTTLSSSQWPAAQQWARRWHLFFWPSNDCSTRKSDQFQYCITTMILKKSQRISKNILYILFAYHLYLYQRQSLKHEGLIYQIWNHHDIALCIQNSTWNHLFDRFAHVKNRQSKRHQREKIV